MTRKLNVIIGLDLSSMATGVVKITKFNEDIGVICKHTITQSSKTTAYNRIFNMTNSIKDELLTDSKEYNIEMVVIEDVYNIRRNLLCLVELRGMIIYQLLTLDINFVIIPANLARKLVDVIPQGKKYTREQGKLLVKHAVEKILKTKFNTDDESDAALLGLSFLKLKESEIKWEKNKAVETETKNKKKTKLPKAPKTIKPKKSKLL